jgi:hypothetical protein
MRSLGVKIGGKPTDMPSAHVELVPLLRTQRRTFDVDVKSRAPTQSSKEFVFGVVKRRRRGKREGRGRWDGMMMEG